MCVLCKVLKYSSFIPSICNHDRIKVLVDIVGHVNRATRAISVMPVLVWYFDIM